MRTKLHFVISRRSPAGNCEKTRSILLVIRSTRKLQGNERGTFDSVGIKSCPIRRCIQNTFFSATFSY